MLSSAMQVSWQRTLDTLRPAAACAEAVAMKVRNLVLSKKGGICCYSTQCGSADVSGYPAAEGQPAIRPLPPPDKGRPFGRGRSSRFLFEALFAPRGEGTIIIFSTERAEGWFFALGSGVGAWIGGQLGGLWVV